MAADRAGKRILDRFDIALQARAPYPIDLARIGASQNKQSGAKVGGRTFDLDPEYLKSAA